MFALTLTLLHHALAHASALYNTKFCLNVASKLTASIIKVLQHVNVHNNMP